MMNSKKLIACLLAVIMAFGLIGCSGTATPDPTPAPTAAPTSGNTVSTTPADVPDDSGLTTEEVIFWGPWDGDVGANIQTIIDAYNAEKGTNVTYVCQADLMNAYQAAAIAGDVPDIMLWDANEVRYYAKMGQLTAIDEDLTAHGVDTADFNDQSIQELTYEGHLYGLPMKDRKSVV